MGESPDMLRGGLRRLVGVLHRLEESLVVLMLLAMIVLTCLQVGLRFFFSSGISWGDPLLRYLVLWTGLLGAGVATRQGRHINVDLVSHFVPPQGLRWLYGGIFFFSAVVCGILAYAAVVFVKNEAAFGGSPTTLGLTYWQLNLIFPAAFFLFLCRFLIAAVLALKGDDG